MDDAIIHRSQLLLSGSPEHSPTPTKISSKLHLVPQDKWAGFFFLLGGGKWIACMACRLDCINELQQFQLLHQYSMHMQLHWVVQQSIKAGCWKDSLIFPLNLGSFHATYSTFLHHSTPSLLPSPQELEEVRIGTAKKIASHRGMLCHIAGQDAMQ